MFERLQVKVGRGVVDAQAGGVTDLNDGASRMANRELEFSALAATIGTPRSRGRPRPLSGPWPRGTTAAQRRAAFASPRHVRDGDVAIGLSLRLGFRRALRQGDLFTVSDKDFKLNISSQAAKGRSSVEPGTYRRVDVSAVGDWSFTIKGR